MPLKNKTVLIFGEDTRSFLTVIRSLSQTGMLVDVVSFSNTSVTLQSTCIRNTYGLNHQSMTIDEWTAEVTKLLIDQQYDLVIPCDERALLPLMDIKKSLNITTIFALPEPQDLEPLFNKVETRLTGQSCDIPVALGNVLQLSDHTFEQLQQTYGLPFVLKPTQSYDEDELNKRQSVKIAHSEQDLIDFIAINGAQPCLVESYFPGYGIGVSILANKGKVKAAFAHARVAEPETGGGSSYRKAIPLDPAMLYACQKFCMKLKYTGVGMFEFKYNPENKDWILIEINARFWGSLPLAVNAGINFPSMYAEILLGFKPLDKLTYNLKAYSRSFTNDIYAMKSEFDSTKLKKGTGSALLVLGKRLFGLSRILTGNDYIDSFKWFDQRPFWHEFYELFKDKIDKLPVIKTIKREKRISRFKQALIANPKTEILFICYGNIMRSPFAGKLFQQKITETSLNSLSVDSFGFHQIDQRKAKPQCVEMAKNWQVDLSDHKSKWLRRHHCLSPNTLVVIMDKKNEYLLQTYYPEIDYISLADLIPSNLGFHHEIADPYDAKPDYLKECYTLIDASIDELTKHIKNTAVCPP